MTNPPVVPPPVVPEDLAPRRARMLDADLAGRGIADGAVLVGVARVPRHEFLPPPLRVHAYDDTALPIGAGQTISQPYVVAFMTQALRLSPGLRVLEIGTGSGYQTAVLAEMGAEVYTIERHEDLSLAAEAVLDRLGYGERITMRVGDGTLGWPEAAPFERILVTAAGPRIPAALAEQLADGGILVIPVGGERDGQRLMVCRKEGGNLTASAELDVRFVPLVGRDGFGGRPRGQADEKGNGG